MKLSGNRYFLLSAIFGVAAFILSVYLKDGTPFTAIGTVALGGGHITNTVERWKQRTPEDDEAEAEG